MFIFPRPISYSHGDVGVSADIKEWMGNLFVRLWTMRQFFNNNNFACAMHILLTAYFENQRAEAFLGSA